MTSQSSFNIATGAIISESYLDDITRHLPTTETATPSTVFEGKQWVRTDTNQILTYTGSAAEVNDGYGAWTSYTPVLTNATAGGIVLGNGTLTGAYRYVGGRSVAFWARFVQGSTTTGIVGSAGALVLGLPVAMASTGQEPANMIHTHIIDVTGGQYPGPTLLHTTSSVYLCTYDTSGTYGTLALFVPGTQFTTAAGDIFTIGGVYESAS